MGYICIALKPFSGPSPLNPRLGPSPRTRPTSACMTESDFIFYQHDITRLGSLAIMLGPFFYIFVTLSLFGNFFFSDSKSCSKSPIFADRS